MRQGLRFPFHKEISMFALRLVVFSLRMVNNPHSPYPEFITALYGREGATPPDLADRVEHSQGG